MVEPVVATIVVVIVVVVVRTVVGCFVVTVVLLAVVKIVVFPSCNVACFCSLDVVVDKTVVVKVLSSRSVTSTVVGFVRVWGSVRGSVRGSVWGSVVFSIDDDLSKCSFISFEFYFG